MGWVAMQSFTRSRVDADGVFFNALYSFRAFYGNCLIPHLYKGADDFAVWEVQNSKTDAHS